MILIISVASKKTFLEASIPTEVRNKQNIGMQQHRPDFNDLRYKINEVLQHSKQAEEVMVSVSAILNAEVDYYDWVGFYILDKASNELVLGPYVGAHTDHTHIPIGKGVCGQVAEKNETIVVQDVSQMENYLSCSVNVQSEIVVPIIKDGKFVAEIDIDSHAYAPFGNDDVAFLEDLAHRLSIFF